MARIVQLSELLEKQRIDNAVTHVWQYVPSGIVTQDVLDNVEKAKQPLFKIYHYHCNHLGTPQELSDQSGDIVWLSYDRAWGGSFNTIYKQKFIDNFAISENELQPIKFQGQSLDVETGLHYNRFRYYDSDVGMFISRDPIGLLGGNNVFQYAPNPVMWIDPVGLSRKTTSFTDSTGFTLDVHGYTDLSHYNDSDLKSLHYLNSPDNPRPFGKSPVDRKGNTIILHHYRQQDMGPIIGMPARQHQSNSKNLHPLGNKGGISNREQFNNWKREFWHNQAAEELKKRGITPNCT